MGLDMWLYEVELPDDNKIPENTSMEDIERILGLTAFRKEYLTEEEGMLEDILPYCVERNIPTIYTRWNKIKEDYNVPKDANQGGFSRNENGWKYRFYKDKECFEVEMTDEEYKKYLYKKPKTYLITKYKEIEYFRKEYDLQTDIYDVYNECSGKCIQNCGHHVLTEEMIDELNDRNEMFRDCHVENIPKAIVYHEWY